MAISFSTLLATLAVATGQGHAVHRTTVIGHSVDGRAIHAVESGTPGRPRVLVVGCIHGNECAGSAVTHNLVRRKPPGSFDLWVIHCVNPDGRKLGVRQNGRGVDLNRNFGSQWIPIGSRWDPEYSGPRKWSEPETRTVRRLVKDLKPELTIWYHQPQTVVRAWGQSVPAARPSGFRLGTSQRSANRGGVRRRSAWMTAIPAHSFPWMQPTTRTRG